MEDNNQGEWQGNVDDLDPLQFLWDDMKSSDLTVRRDAARNIPTVAINIGPELSRTKLFPYLEEFCFPAHASMDPTEPYEKFESNEEIMMEIAKMLRGENLSMFGKLEEAGSAVINLLQKLCMVEEPVIRSVAIDSLLSCIEKAMDSEMLKGSIVRPLLSNLTDSAGWISRVSATKLLVHSYRLISDERQRGSIREMVFKLIKDEMPIVREEAYRTFKDILYPGLIKTDGIKPTIQFLSPILKCMNKETAHNMRVNLCDVVARLIQTSRGENEQYYPQQVLDMVKEFIPGIVNDRNWLVRSHFVKNILIMMDGPPKAWVCEHLVNGFLERLEDAEPTVRVAAIGLLPDFLATGIMEPAKIAERIDWEGIRRLVTDEHALVREAMSRAYLTLFEVVSNKMDFLETVKLFQNDDSGEVRLNFCLGMTKCYEILGEENFVKHMLPIMLKIQEDHKWRVRCSVLHHLPLITKLSRAGKLTEKQLNKLIIAPFVDPVSAVREKSAAKIPGLIDSMGAAWVQDTIFRVTVRDYFQPKSKYLLRIVPVRIGFQIANHLARKEETKDGEVLESAFRFVCNGATDSISNIRLLALVKINEFMSKPGAKRFRDGLLSILEGLESDRDIDIMNALRQAKETYAKYLK